ncbi:MULTISPECIES: hypothetical protein [Photorhabdus]|uniref:Uncharacterized protein n=1 Tax=Photorhabdus thracensis TaxID=230089 RepID=A0A0F7LNN4_9GAMM|nr:hypothetical protein [Photorhabdus thracensis]AKH64125.1 hypothetical protein VY86_13140 [Photorhabdus thracensis]
MNNWQLEPEINLGLLKYTEVKGDFAFIQEDFLLCLKVGTMGVTIGGIEFWFIYYRQYNSRK